MLIALIYIFWRTFIETLKNNFFEQLLEKVDQQFFEGKADRRLPKKEWCIEHSLEMAERIITHSIVQGGPGFPVLCPAVFNYTGLRLYCKRSSAQKWCTTQPFNCSLVGYNNRGNRCSSLVHTREITCTYTCARIKSCQIILLICCVELYMQVRMVNWLNM